MIDCEFDTLILSLVLIWIFYVFNFNLQLSTEIHTEDFENNTLDSFLEAMKNWIEDMDGYYKNIGMREYNDKTLNWSMLADILNASRIYE